MKNNILFIFIFFISCVEHKFSFIVSPNGTYNVEYIAHGDRSDLEDLDFVMPYGNKWNIISTLDSIEAESYDYSAQKKFNKNEIFPSTFYKGDSLYNESLLKHNIQVKYLNWFFGKKYKFEVTFQGRKVINKYPLVLGILEDSESPSKDWIKQALKYLLFETVNLTDVEWNIRPIMESELNNWIKTELYFLSDSIIFEEFDYYKNLGLDIIMQPISPVYYDTMDSIFKSLEDELRVTIDLMNDEFDFKLILPGILKYTDADSIKGDTLFWSFGIENYINDDYVLNAVSSINYPKRQILGVILLFLSCFLIIKKNKKFKYGKNF